MDKRGKQLFEIICTFCFENTYEITDDDTLLVDSIKIYDVYNLDEEIDFEISSVDGKKTIYPISNKKYFYLMAKKIVEGYKLEIKKDDYLSSTDDRGNYSFVISDVDDFVTNVLHNNKNQE